MQMGAIKNAVERGKTSTAAAPLATSPNPDPKTSTPQGVKVAPNPGAEKDEGADIGKGRR